MQNLWHQPSHSLHVRGDEKSWIASIGLGIAVGVAYLLTAHLSLSLLTKPDCVAVFWPAAGIATGTLIALGPKVRLPVAVAVWTAGVVASLLHGLNFPASIVFASCNAGEAILVAWLITQRFGRGFRLDSLRNVLGFFAAAGIGPAVSAIPATAGFILFYNSAAPIPTTLLNWFASDALGIIMVAPLVIGLGGLRHDWPKRWELMEGAFTLVALAAASALAVGSPTHYWSYTVLPLGLLLPALLAAHCRPVFAAAATLIIACAVVWATTFGMGDLGEIPSLPDRAFAARATLLAIAAFTLVLAALFAERRHSEAALKSSNDRLQLALGGAELGVWSLDTKTGRFESDARDGLIHDHQPDAPPRTLAAARSYVHPADLPLVDAAFAASKRTGGRCKIEYRLAPTVGGVDLSQERWVALEGTVLRDANGQPDHLLGVTRDITLHKRAERALADRNLQLALAGKFALVGTYAYDVGSERYQVSPGYAAVHGLPEGTEQTSRAEWRTRVHPDDLPSVDAGFHKAMADRRREYHCEYRFACPDGEIRWIDSRNFISYAHDGSAPRLVGANIDITQRKETELVLAERNAQLALAGRAALVGSYVYDVKRGTMQISQGYATIHGLPEDTSETTIREWRARVHPEDLARAEGLREQAFTDRQKEDNAEYRIVLPTGEVRWIERRGTISYDQMGLPKRVVGVNIDVTDRKRAEERQRMLIAELDHRVKNALATVSSVISQTADRNRSMADFVAALNGRVRSMATTQELLSSNRWQGISLTELVRRELAPYATPHNTKTNGPKVLLHPEAGRAIAMVLHELATNAAKYGALSTETGRVSIQWHLRMNGRPQSSLVLEWQEIGGPPVVPTGKPSYGTSTICDLIPYEFGGTADLVKAPDGVRCHLELPGDWLSNDGEAASGSIARANGQQDLDALMQVAPKALWRDAKSDCNETRGPRLAVHGHEGHAFRAFVKNMSDRHVLLARIPKPPNLEYWAHIQSALSAVESHIVKGEYRLFEHGKIMEKLKDRNALILAHQLQRNLETALRFMHLRRVSLLKDLSRNSKAPSLDALTASGRNAPAGF